MGGHGPELELDTDAAVAAVGVIGRMGALDVEVGYLDDTERSQDARWWASARWNGTKVQVAKHQRPDQALEALARQLMEGGTCTHCGQRIHLGGAPAGLRRRHPRLCAWKRQGREWVRGCIDRVPEGQRVVPTTGKRGDLPRLPRRRL